MLKFILSKLKPHHSLISAGDVGQLPAVQDDLICEDEIYKQFDVVELKQMNRQSEDNDFFQLCNTLRKTMTRAEAFEFLNKLNERVLPIPSVDTLVVFKMTLSPIFRALGLIDLFRASTCSSMPHMYA